METTLFVTSLFNTEFRNSGIDITQVKKLKLGSTIPSPKRLWMIFFFEEDESGKEAHLETWFYSSRTDRRNELHHLKEEFPHLAIC